MVVNVYGHISSAPTRLVLMTCETLQLYYNFNVVDILAGEHKTPEYAKVKNDTRSFRKVVLILKQPWSFRQCFTQALGTK